MKRLTNASTYKVETDRAVYAVHLEHGKNTDAGQPRFKASIITLQVKGEPEPEGCYYTTTWTFLGHYLNDQDEAKWIVERYEEKLER